MFKISSIISKFTFYIFIILIVTMANRDIFANPLLNINPEDHLVYDIFESSVTSLGYITTIKPINNYKAALFVNKYERVKQNVNVLDGVGFYWKPLGLLSLKFYYTEEAQSYLEGMSGLKLKKGINFFLFQDGFFSLSKYCVIYYQFKQTFRKDTKKFDLHRAYAKLFFYKFSIEGGVDNLNLGPGDQGLIISNNSPPFPLILIKTEEPIKLLGKWEFLFFNGWLIEDRGDYNNPMFMGYKVAWKPIDFIEIGLTRAVLHGGDGRSEYEWWEYFDLFISSRGRKSKERFDYDALGAYDLTVYLPFHLLTDVLEVTKFYFQVAGTDILSPWQHKDKRAFQYGLFMSIKYNYFRIEYIETGKNLYTQYNYNVNDYTYKKLSLGYPYGRDIKTVQFKHRFFILDNLSVEYKIGWLRTPASSSNKMDRYLFSLLIDYRVWELILEGYFRYDYAENYDSNFLPTKFNIINGKKEYISFGFSLTWKL